MKISRYHPVIKLLSVVVITELLIMSGLHYFTDDASPWLLDMLDVVLLGLITAVVAQLWIVRPLADAREQDALFRAISEDSYAGIIITDPARDNAIVYANPAFSRMTGYSMAETKDRDIHFLTTGLDHQSDEDKIMLAMKGAEPVHALLKNRRKNGTVFWNDFHLSPIQLDGNSPRYWLGLLHDVSETRALNLQVEHLVSAVEQAGEMICIFDQQGRIDFANRAFTTQIGLNNKKLKKQLIWDYWCDETCSHTAVLEALDLNGQWLGRNQWQRANSEPYEAMTNISVVMGDDEHRMYIAVIRDMTQEIEVGNQLVQAQKMEAVGVLAGGIAHDFNNMLAAMMGNLYMLKKSMHEDHDVVRRIESIEAQGHRGADLIRQMLVFARKKTVDRQNLDLQILGKEISKLLQTSTPEDISLNVDIDTTSMMLFGDPSLLQSCIFNLVNNARHAIEDAQSHANIAGVINLSVYAVPVDAVSGEIREIISASGAASVRQCAHISVSDNGLGMDEKTRNRVFEPFFTTKEAGRGTGLGLPMVMGCVEMHGGWIGLTSSPEKGTSIDIYLPLNEVDVEAIEAADHAICQGRGEWILLADDNVTLCESVCEVLEEAGYRVLVAFDGEQALQKYMEHKADIRMAILDCVMPKLGGVEVAQKIWQHSGDTVKTVLMTGYDLDGSLLSEWPCREQPVLLQKPWQMEQLNETLKSLKQVRDYDPVA
ncbi:blue-light-activated protein [Mariprofundus micogutta]|uniref:histidine kinase n=1 Tax=Mariprofundus micogutta TaxID=1921010 RepID=A0A1L8CNY8_9PROT|nr:PAS domain S-box protein [Mariprofundus micogutta]GAV20549.1 blue-light-activated protein [Mariprofundus micogutta]